jgi:signal transduction histidine kinase
MKLMRRMPRISMELPERSDITGSEVPGAAPEQADAPKPHPGLARLSRLAGLEGKIVVVVMSLLTAALGSTCWLWASRIDSQVMDILGEQARETAVTLSMAARPSMTAGDVAAMRAMGGDLLKTSNILFVAFYDMSGKNIALASRQTSMRSAPPSLLSTEVSSLAQVRMGTSDALGEYLEVCQPVLEGGSGGRVSRLMGYVSVGISPTQEKLQVQRVDYLAMGIGCVVILGILPPAYLLVHRIFLPIRKLVRATNRIAGGDLDVAVAIDRSDAIGDLARSFNAMIATVKGHQQDLRRANHRLEEANDQLEQKVAQRTGQLEAANRRLSSEIAEKEDFLRAVSHDLNAPLRNISGMASMLLTKHAERFDEEIVHRLQRIQKNVEVETDLISELLELSRIKTRREKMEPVETGAVVRELEGMFENDLKSGQIQLIVDTPLPVVNGERSRIRRAFQNLIDNAIKYMGDGTAREIHVGCAVRATEAEFYVRDTGMGIDAEDVGTVFCIFRRGRNSASRHVPGKGVGLSCVKSIIETYGGSVWVQSEPGHGSTFRFTINGQFVPESGQQFQARNVA